MSTPSKKKWTDLQGEHVQVTKQGRVIRVGRVEEITHAGDGVWLEAHGVEHRALFYKGEGYEVEPAPFLPKDQK